jgi:hypothetical protein
MLDGWIRIEDSWVDSASKSTYNDELMAGAPHELVNLESHEGKYHGSYLIEFQNTPLVPEHPNDPPPPSPGPGALGCSYFFKATSFQFNFDSQETQDERRTPGGRLTYQQDLLITRSGHGEEGEENLTGGVTLSFSEDKYKLLFDVRTTANVTTSVTKWHSETMSHVPEDRVGQGPAKAGGEAEGKCDPKNPDLFAGTAEFSGRTNGTFQSFHAALNLQLARMTVKWKLRITTELPMCFGSHIDGLPDASTDKPPDASTIGVS